MTTPNPGEPKEAAAARLNALQLCPECGAEMTANEAMLDCGACGFRLRGAPTPAVEGIENFCRNARCLHALDPEHDAFGCHVPGCVCTETRRPIERPEDALPNALHSEYKGYIIHPTGNGTTGIQKKSAPGSDVMTVNGGDNEAKIWIDKNPLTENTNANDSWLQKVAKASGVPFAEVQRKWNEHVRTVSNENPSTFQSEFLDWYGLRENSNALRPAQEAFEAHVAACANCGAEYANAAPDPAKLCAEGQKLLTANTAENAGEGGANPPRENRDVAAKGGDEAGKPGGTVTVVNAGDNEMIEEARALIVGGAPGPMGARAAFQAKHPEVPMDRIAHFISSAYRRMGLDAGALSNAYVPAAERAAEGARFFGGRA